MLLRGRDAQSEDSSPIIKSPRLYDSHNSGVQEEANYHTYLGSSPSRNNNYTMKSPSTLSHDDDVQHPENMSISPSLSNEKHGCSDLIKKELREAELDYGHHPPDGQGHLMEDSCREAEDVAQDLSMANDDHNNDNVQSQDHERQITSSSS